MNGDEVATHRLSWDDSAALRSRPWGVELRRLAEGSLNVVQAAAAGEEETR